ncbi:MAG: hypothetical protein M3020_08650 [Myxococcota bacterium]|nr:hypothetical protein [Myxococcota bacterium]
MTRCFSWCLCALLLATAPACAVGNRLVGSRSDYVAYRKTRVAEAELDRLGAANRYLKDHPDGRYHEEVAGWFPAAEQRYVKRAHDRPSMLRAYLAALPDGPRAGDVQARLTELEIYQGYQNRDAQREAERLSRVARELGDATETRQAFVRQLSELVKRLATLRSFGKPLAQGEPALLSEFRDASGKLECATDRCSKTFLLSYAVPGQSQFVARDLALELSIRLYAGRIVDAELAGPELWSRLGEAVERRAVSEQSLSARVDALARSAQVLENVLESRLPAAECAGEVVAPQLLVRDCRGVRIEMRAGVEEPPRDVLVVSPSRRPPAP